MHVLPTPPSPTTATTRLALAGRFPVLLDVVLARLDVIAAICTGTIRIKRYHKTDDAFTLALSYTGSGCVVQWLSYTGCVVHWFSYTGSVVYWLALRTLAGSVIHWLALSYTVWLYRTFAGSVIHWLALRTLASSDVQCLLREMVRAVWQRSLTTMNVKNARETILNKEAGEVEMKTYLARQTMATCWSRHFVHTVSVTEIEGAEETWNASRNNGCPFSLPPHFVLKGFNKLLPPVDPQNEPMTVDLFIFTFVTPGMKESLAVVAADLCALLRDTQWHVNSCARNKHRRGSLILFATLQLGNKNPRNYLS